MSDDEIEERLNTCFKKQSMENFDMNRYRSLDEIFVHNMM